MWLPIRCVALVTLWACSRAAPDPVPPPCATPASVAADATTRAELVAARDTVWRAYYAGDTTTLARVLPEPMAGMGQSRADIIAEANDFAHGRRLLALEFTCDEFYVAGNVAVVFSNYRVEHEVNGRREHDAGRAIEVFERRDSGWVNPSWHLDPYE